MKAARIKFRNEVGIKPFAIQRRVFLIFWVDVDGYYAFTLERAKENLAEYLRHVNNLN